MSVPQRREQERERFMPDETGYRWKSIGGRIREARVKMGLTQRQLGELLEVTPHTVWYWESGKSKPTHEHLVELAYRCEVSTDWLLGRDGVEAKLREETNASFSDAIAGLPKEDLNAIFAFIEFVRERRRARS